MILTRQRHRVLPVPLPRAQVRDQLGIERAHHMLFLHVAGDLVERKVLREYAAPGAKARDAKRLELVEQQ